MTENDQANTDFGARAAARAKALLIIDKFLDGFVIVPNDSPIADGPVFMETMQQKLQALRSGLCKEAPEVLTEFDKLSADVLQNIYGLPPGQAVSAI